MEYIFQNASGAITRVELREFQITVHRGDKVYAIPHSAISHVRLERNKNCYSIDIRSTDFGSVRICCTPTESPESQAVQYNTFVHTLHQQLLKNRCPVEFYSGFRPANLTEKICALLLVSILIYSVEDYFNFTPIHPATLVLLITGVVVLLTSSLYLVKNSRNYNPANIPLTMLPPVL